MSGIGVLGAGAFGTAIAITLARDGTEVTLRGRDPAAMAEMQRSRRNARYLPDAEWPESVRAEAAPGDAQEDVLLVAVPTQALQGFLSEHGARLDGRMLVLCCKGVDLATGLGPSDVAAGACPASPIAVMTGPSFAADIALGLPTALTLACRDAEIGRALQNRLSRESLRLYLGDDVRGAELGGALKNIVAIGAGVVIGAGFGESARAALIARGFAEMQRIAEALGCQSQTLVGLSGLGDLVLTAVSEKSRNYRAGLELGRGRALPEGVTIEGAATSEAVARIARERGIEAPLTITVAAIVSGALTADDARDRLLARPLRSE